MLDCFLRRSPRKALRPKSVSAFCTAVFRNVRQLRYTIDALRALGHESGSTAVRSARWRRGRWAAGRAGQRNSRQQARCDHRVDVSGCACVEKSRREDPCRLRFCNRSGRLELSRARQAGRLYSRALPTVRRHWAEKDWICCSTHFPGARKVAGDVKSFVFPETPRFLTIFDRRRGPRGGGFFQRVRWRTDVAAFDHIKSAGARRLFSIPTIRCSDGVRKLQLSRTFAPPYSQSIPFRRRSKTAGSCHTAPIWAKAIDAPQRSPTRILKGSSTCPISVEPTQFSFGINIASAKSARCHDPADVYSRHPSGGR